MYSRPTEAEFLITFLHLQRNTKEFSTEEKCAQSTQNAYNYFTRFLLYFFPRNFPHIQARLYLPDKLKNTLCAAKMTVLK